MPCYYIIYFGCLMGFNMLFYIVFGTNLLTGGPVPVSNFLPILEFRRKRISNGVQTEWNLRERDFRNKRDPEDLDPTSRHQPGRHEVGGHALHPRGAHVAPPTYFFLLYIRTYPQTIRGIHENLIPPPQPSVPTRSHLGACSGAPPEGASITEGFYINTIASPMKCE